MADYTFNPRPGNTAPTRSPGGEERGGARIWNVFSPTIILDELSIQEMYNQDTKTQKTEDMVSTIYPLIKINDYYISQEEIDYFSISTEGKIPEITLTASFYDELFISKNLPLDGDIISIAIQGKSDLLKPIRNDYVITGIRTSKKNSDVPAISMTFFGILFVPGFDSFPDDFSFRGTSMEAMKNLARILQLGFNTNETGTDDHQIWLSVSSPKNFAGEVTDRAWKDENSFFDWWIDIYYNLNFINVQKQLLAPEQELDGAALVDNVPSNYWWGSSNDETVGTAKVFSNYANFRTSSFYIKRWRPINNSSKITFEYGTSPTCKFFEHNNVLYEDAASRKYWVLESSPSYDQEKVNSHILLRGRTTWDASSGAGETARANYNYNDLYKRSTWTGIQYTISNPEDSNAIWTGNQHRNYMRARVHNTINNIELQKLNVQIEVQGVNLNIIRGDKVPIALIKKDRLEAIKIENDFEQAEMLDKFYSGWYYVSGFKLYWTPQNEDMLSNFHQDFTLTRREWPTPVQTVARNNENNQR